MKKLKELYSNTTNVKVKPLHYGMELHKKDNSNTTNVKVKPNYQKKIKKLEGLFKYNKC